MTPEEQQAFDAGRKLGTADVELAILRQYEAALKAGNGERRAKLKLAVSVVRELVPELCGASKR
jgi:hypothetical protein